MTRFSSAKKPVATIKIEELQKNGTTFLLVSHQAAQVKKLCKTALWIKNGEIVMYDEAEKVSDAYAADCNKQ